jgi:hypothetical protein
MLARKIFYLLKPFIPRRLQLAARRNIIRWKQPLYTDVWPIDKTANKALTPWCGWPDKKQFALVLTHDVETAKGQEKCHKLIKLEEQLAFRSAFYFVPRRYAVSSELRQYLSGNGFEVGVHGLYHDGKLFSSRDEFKKRAVQINQYIKDWGAVGFRSPAMHYNLEWMHDLYIEYDSSTLDTAPFEPQPEGVRTIFPFFVSGSGDQKGYTEIPCTMPEDFTIFILLKESNINTWIQKLDWIAKHGGMALFISHPDYMNFEGKKLEMDEYPAEYYVEILKYIKSKYEGQYWHALPKDLALYCQRLH